MSKEKRPEKIFPVREERDLTRELAAKNKQVMSDSGNPGNSSDNSPSPSQGEGTSVNPHANQPPSAETGGDSSVDQTSEGK